MLDCLTADLRFAARMLRKKPLFTAVAVGCIALGSGAVATIFSAMNAMVLRPLPDAADATRLARIERKAPGALDGITASYPYYEYLRDHARSVSGLVAWGARRPADRRARRRDDRQSRGGQRDIRSAILAERQRARTRIRDLG